MKPKDNRTIVVTGGAGFIGSCIVKQLNAQGISNIVVVDELGHSEKWKNLVGKKLNDIIEKEQFFSWLEGKGPSIKAFIHMGACSSTVETDASYLLDNNYRFSVKLAEYALRHGQRFIYASSAATYGDGAKGFSDDHQTIDELHPLNMYGFSKQLFDQWVKNQGHLERMVGLKFFNVFGPNEWHKGRMASAVHHILPTAKKEGVVKLFKSSEPEKFSDGGQMRDFVYVKDVARMVTAFLDNEAAGIYNIGSGRASTWNELALAVFKALNQPGQIEYIDMPQDLIGKYQNYTCADMAKTRAVLKDTAVCMPFEDAVIDYVRNHLLPGHTW